MAAQMHTDRSVIKGKALGPICNDDIYVTNKCCVKKCHKKETEGGKGGGKVIAQLNL